MPFDPNLRCLLSFAAGKLECPLSVSRDAVLDRVAKPLLRDLLRIARYRLRLSMDPPHGAIALGAILGFLLYQLPNLAPRDRASTQLQRLGLIAGGSCP